MTMDIMCSLFAAGIKHFGTGWPGQWVAINNTLSMDIPEA